MSGAATILSAASMAALVGALLVLSVVAFRRSRRMPALACFLVGAGLAVITVSRLF